MGLFELEASQNVRFVQGDIRDCQTYLEIGHRSEKHHFTDLNTYHVGCAQHTNKD